MKRTVCILTIIIMCVSLAACGQGRVEFNVPESGNTGAELSDEPINKSLFDNAEVTERRAAYKKIYGNSYENEIYDKSAYAEVNVENEAEISGELWFPPINNSAALEDIAPTIPRELAEKLYNIPSYYPDDPENYTAQAVNESVFPIAFFRKVNDCVYYTVCKVEDRGYMYLFFLVNSNVTPEAANIDAGRAEDATGYTDHLYRADLADLGDVDITAEAIWRASIYSEKNLGTMEEFIAEVNEKFGLTQNTMPDGAVDIDVYGIGNITEIDPASSLAVDSIDILLNNSHGNKEAEYELELWNSFHSARATGTGKINAIVTRHLCTDGVVIINWDTAVPDETMYSSQSSKTIYNTPYISSGAMAFGENASLTAINGEEATELNWVTYNILSQDRISR